MTKNRYLRLSKPFRESDKKQAALQRINQVGALVVSFCYIGIAIALAIGKDIRLIRYLVIPALAFLAVSAFRVLVNAPRPYEVWDIQPLIKREEQGRSFPSRHVFSGMMIAMAILSIHVSIGILMLLIATLLAAIRVVAGVHFIKDVVVGAMIGIVVGMLGFFVF